MQTRKLERWQELGYASFREWRLADQKARNAAKAAATAAAKVDAPAAVASAGSQQRAPSQQRYYHAAAPAPVPPWPSYEERLARVDVPVAALDGVLQMDGEELAALLSATRPAQQHWASAEAFLLMRRAIEQNPRLRNLLLQRKLERTRAACMLEKAKRSRQLKRERDACYREERGVKPRAGYNQAAKWYD